MNREPITPLRRSLLGRGAWSDVSIVWIGAALSLSAVVVVALLFHVRIKVDPLSRGLWMIVLALSSFAAIRLHTHDARSLHHRRLRDFSECALAMILIFVMGALANYGEAVDTTGFYDATLEHGDRLLHFDWLALYTFVAAHPVLQYAGALAYNSIYLTPLVILGWFAWHGERCRNHAFVMTFWVAAVLTLLIFPFVPARGALEFLWHGPIHYMPTNGLYQGEIIPALRSHAMSEIDLGTVRGLVCAPSFHTACAVIFIATAWPVSALRPVLVPVNVAMLMATPVEGTHYLTDMVLGAVVGLVSIALVHALRQGEFRTA